MIWFHPPSKHQWRIILCERVLWQLRWVGDIFLHRVESVRHTCERFHRKLIELRHIRLAPSNNNNNNFSIATSSSSESWNNYYVRFSTFHRLMCWWDWKGKHSFFDYGIIASIKCVISRYKWHVMSDLRLKYTEKKISCNYAQQDYDDGESEMICLIISLGKILHVVCIIQSTATRLQTTTTTCKKFPINIQSQGLWFTFNPPHYY